MVVLIAVDNVPESNICPLIEKIMYGELDAGVSLAVIERGERL